MESHASAARTREVAAAGRGPAVAVRRLRWDSGVAICVTLAGALAAIAFIGNGGLQLGSSTLVEVAVILGVGLLVAAALVFAATDAPLYGGTALAGLAALAGITALSILWSLHPADSWIETNRTLAYLAAFAGGIAAVRLFPRRWEPALYGVLIALAIVCLYGLATKVAPGWLAEDEVYARLREPYGYWNAVGVTAAMGIPICLWLGTREGSPQAKALAYPILGILIVTMLLSFSRGSIIAATVGVALWLALVPRRLATLAVLLPSVVGAALVTAWAFGQSALTDDRVALAEREDSGIAFGLILVGMAVALFAAGLLIERRARTRPLSEGTRRTLGKLALGSLAAVPLIVLAGLAFSERGIGGTVSDRWDELTSAEKTPQNDPGRLIEAGNVRTIYWARAMDVWREHEVTGAGAGSFAQAQLRFRDEPTQGRHAHGYVHQTLADLGLIGLGASLAALVGWLLATPRHPRSHATPHFRGMDPRAHRAACAWVGGSRVRRALRARLDLVCARGRGHGPVLRRLGRGPRSAAPRHRTGTRGRRSTRGAAQAAARAARRRGARSAGAGRGFGGRGRAAVACRPRGRRGSGPARQGRLLRRAGGGRAGKRHQSTVRGALLRARRDRGRRGQAPRRRAGARGRRAARARQPRGVATTGRLLRGQPRRSRPGGPGPPGRAVPRPGLAGQPQRVPRGTARPQRGDGRARGRRARGPQAPRRAARGGTPTP